MKQLGAEEQKAEQAVAQTKAELHRAEDEKVAALRLCAVLFAVVFLLLVVVVVLMRTGSSKSQALAEPLLEPAKIEPKLFEGEWQRDDGQRVSIQGSTLVHPDDTEERLAE